MLSEKQNDFIIEAKGLTKKFGPFEALSNASLQIKPGTIHAILGENGAGKTTLLKLLFGIYKATKGEVLYNNKKIVLNNPTEAIRNGVGMVQQHFTLVEELSAIDNIILGAEPDRLGILDRKQAIMQLESSLPSPYLSVPWEALVQDLSVGQKQKVEILKLLYRKSKILFLDEPTAVLTPNEIEDFFNVLKKLKSQGCTIILITHKLNEVFALCDEATVLRQGHVVGRADLKDIQPDQIVEWMIGRKPVPLSGVRTASNDQIVFACEGIKEQDQERGRLKDVSFRVNKGEIVGIAGVEGSGQSHLVDAILGLRAFEGRMSINGRTVIYGSVQASRDCVALVPEDRLAQGLWAQASCFHNLIIGLEESFGYMGWLNEARIRALTPTWASEWDVRASSLDSAVGSLSGGNQQKIILARETRGKNADFMICHHPTRGVDIGALEMIHSEFLSLRNQGHSFMLISADMDELLALSDRIIVLFDGRSVKEFLRSDFDKMAIGRYMTGAQL